MPSNTTEKALEVLVEIQLTGTSLERIQRGESPEADHHGYHLGRAADYDARYALDVVNFWAFLEATQPRELAKLQRAPDWQQKVLSRYDNMARKRGIPHLLRNGLKVADAHLTLFYELPPAGSGQILTERYASNRWSEIRQLRYNQNNPQEEIDMVLFVNGLPLVTIELKNAWTGQRARVQGIKQYQNDRDARQPLLQFGRCLVHMTADTEEVWMTTKLSGQNTNFLPFNRGTEDHGAGNPAIPGRHRTAYLWHDIFRPDSLANILQHFIRFDGDAKTPLDKQTLFFPRFHQLDVVRKLIEHAGKHGAGQSYLIQHSAGSGKSNSITWAAYQLIEVMEPGSQRPLFDSVIVVTDRRLLDRQLRDNIKSFNLSKGIIAAAKKSTDLRRAMEDGKRIIITTIQKFPFIVEEIGDLSDKRFAVIIDEAHSGQSGTAAAKMNESMGMIVNDVMPTYGAAAGAKPGNNAGREEEGNEEEETDNQDLVLNALRGRKMRSNASYLAFTATPKNATLERFGVRQPDGSYRPFHLYSMKQAIQEEFILDVLHNYTTYRSYYELTKSVEDNPEFDVAKAQKKLRAYVEAHPSTIATKAEIVLDHFLTHVVAKKRLRGKAKGMVVTQNISTAIRYYQALKRLLADRNNLFKIVVAFSGKKLVDGLEHTEASLNGFSDVKEEFEKEEYRLLVVANKFLTGFDQPKLTAMYVDKKLAGVLAVQALSRLNRANKKLDKKKEDLFVLDFFNTAEEIKVAFDPYFTVTSLSEGTNVDVLHDILDTLAEYGLYDFDEVRAFTANYLSGADGDRLSGVLDPAVDRFNRNLEEEEKVAFKVQAKQFVKLYSQVASIIPYEVRAWEELYWFLKFLIPKLIVRTPAEDDMDDILESVDLATYAVAETRGGMGIVLDEDAGELDPNNSDVRTGAGATSDADELDAIIRAFNERYYEGWDATDEEKRIKFIALRQSIEAHPDYRPQVADNSDRMTADLALERIFEEVIHEQSRKDLDFYKLMMKDRAARRALLGDLRRVLE